MAIRPEDFRNYAGPKAEGRLDDLMGSHERAMKLSERRCVSTCNDCGVGRMSDARSPVNFTAINNYLSALRSQVDGIEECVGNALGKRP
jgi:hypothetical protein